MKSIANYINESLLTESVHILKLRAATAQRGVKIEDALKAFCKYSKTRYSFNNKQDLDKFFKAFCEYSKISNTDLKAFGITDGASIARLLINKKEDLEKEGWKFDAIKSFDETEMQKEYKAWKASDDYAEGKKFNRDDYKDADEETLVRTLVVYDVNDPGNPETTLQYDYEGKRNKDNEHQTNMRKMDWHYATNLKYYDARPILLSNYLKKSDEELAKRDVMDDIIGKND